MLFLTLKILMAAGGVWSAWGINRGNWSELALLLDSNGFDKVFYCAAYGPEVDREGLLECISACSEYGIEVHAWVVMWKTGHCSDSLQNAYAEQNRLQHSIDDDSSADTWLCPTDPRNVTEMASICLALAEEFPVAGIHLDYIRYAHDRVCYCNGCHERFSRETSLYGISWPEDCFRGGGLYDRYNQWRSDAITGAVRAIRDSLLDRDVLLSAAVMPRAREQLYYGQRWDEWLQRELIDFAVPMNYTLSDSELISWSETQIRMSGGGRILCGLTTRTGDRQHTAQEITAQQNRAPEMGFDGWVIFHLSDSFVSILESAEPPDRLH